MREFVRLKFDGSPFTSPNNAPAPEGSRASGKIAWHSQIDVVNDFGAADRQTGKWVRNPAATAVNNIALGPIDTNVPAP